MDQHPKLGFLKLSDPAYNEVKKIVVTHHEHQSHSYPGPNIDRKKSNKNIPFKIISVLSEIVAVADMYDALSHTRSYHKKFKSSSIKKIIKQNFTGNPKYVQSLLTENNIK